MAIRVASSLLTEWSIRNATPARAAMSVIISSVMTASAIRASEARCSVTLIAPSSPAASAALVLRLPALLEGGDGLQQVRRRHRGRLQRERQVEDLAGPLRQ